MILSEPVVLHTGVPYVYRKPTGTIRPSPSPISNIMDQVKQVFDHSSGFLSTLIGSSFSKFQRREIRPALNVQQVQDLVYMNCAELYADL